MPLTDHLPHPRLFLLRHGETTFNLEGRYQGGCDSALTARGQAQARACALRLAGLLAPPPGLTKTGRPVQLLVSPQGRAQETAALVGAELRAAGLILAETRTDARLREVSLGAWDGRTRAEIEQIAPAIRKQHPRGQWFFHAPEGETLESVLVRARELLDDLFDELSAAPDAGDRILISHAITGRVLRGLHAGQDMGAALQAEARQDVVLELTPEGGILSHPLAEPV